MKKNYKEQWNKNDAKTNDRNGILDFVNIMQQMKEVDCIEFDLGDIVRSGMLKSYLIEKIKMGLHYEQ